MPLRIWPESVTFLPKSDLLPCSKPSKRVNPGRITAFFTLLDLAGPKVAVIHAWLSGKRLNASFGHSGQRRLAQWRFAAAFFHFLPKAAKKHQKQPKPAKTLLFLVRHAVAQDQLTGTVGTWPGVARCPGWPRGPIWPGRGQIGLHDETGRYLQKWSKV